MPGFFDTTNEADEQMTENEASFFSDDAVAELESQADEVSDVMAIAQQRFIDAQYYNSLLTTVGFEGDNSPTATKIVREVQNFIRSRLAVLLGVQQEPSLAQRAESQFTEEEAKVLKQLVSKLLKKPELAEAKAPVVKKTASPTNIAVVKQAKPPAPLVKTEKAPVKPGPKPRGRPRKQIGAMEIGTEKYEHGTDEHGNELLVQVNNPSIKYLKMSDQRGEYWSYNNQKWIIALNEANKQFFKNVTPPARPIGVRPVPPLNRASMAVIAAQHAKIAENNDSVASGKLNQATTFTERG